MGRLVVLLASWVLLCASVPLSALAQTCSNSVLLASGAAPTEFATCVHLPRLASNFAWTYNASSRLLDFAFQSTLSNADGWAGWGIHPSALVMYGASALIAFNAPNGTNLLPYTLSVAGANPTPAIGFEVIEGSKRVVISSDLGVTFGATIRLEEGQTTIFHLWNTGDSVTDFVPSPHPMDGDHRFSVGSLDVTTGAATEGGIPHIDLKNNHGIVNVVGWGILFPLGVMVARYMRPFKVFDPLWFYIHVPNQVVAYVLGVVGWGLGLKLGSYDPIPNHKHRNLGIAMFVFATVQMSALLLRPKPESKYRIYWNVFHHSVGFSVIIMSIINVFEGFDLLSPDKGWKIAYIVILIVMAVVALILEVTTWMVWFANKRKVPAAKLGGEEGRANGGVVGNNPQQWGRESQL